MEIIDFLYDFSKTQFSIEMEEKYWRKLPSITIEETVQYIVNNNLQSLLVEKSIKDISEVFIHENHNSNQYDHVGKVRVLNGNELFTKSYLFYKVKEKYELYVYNDRGGYELYISTSIIEEALFKYIEIIFNSYGVNASDTTIV